MGLAAFAAYERGTASKGFREVAVSMIPLKALNAQEPGPMLKLDEQACVMKSDVKDALGGAIDAHRDALKAYGFGVVHHARAENVMSPGMDGMLLAAMAVAPVIAPAVSAMTLANILSYARADRLTKKKSGVLEDVFRAKAAASSFLESIRWDNPGYHRAIAANDNEEVLSREQVLYLTQDIFQQRFVQVLQGQAKQISDVQASNLLRLDKGLPLSFNTVDHALQKDSVWLVGNFNVPVPGYV